MNETNHQNCIHSPRSVSEMAYIPQPRPAPGLDSLYMLCKRIYPDQWNPLQATTLLKYWLGGEDPLDYISMYNNPGDRMIGIPAHWHYIGFGLSNLHGDTRVHRFSKGPNAPSGFGFELTFRLLKDSEEHNPPTWPAHLMQSLAKYVFATGNTLYAGDHVSWHCGLDGSRSRLQHMLMGEDPQLQVTGTPYGTVRFIQIVGVCLEELQAVQRWNGPGVLQILKRHSVTGGPWLVTNMRRSESMFDVDLSVHDEIAEGIKTEGSNLCGISVNCSWKESNKISNKPGYTSVEHSMGNLCIINNSRATNEDKKEIDSNSKYTNCELSDLAKTRYIEEVHLTFNLEAGLLLPFVLKGRIRHGRHFTFKALDGKSTITFVSPSVSGAAVSDEKPFAAHETWLQVLVPNSFIDTMESSLKFLNEPILEPLPKTITWPDRNLTITIKPDGS
ncbi:Suppressor of fused-like domain,Suppressor of fused C-terminal,Suppressor of fused, eukaryotic [Cinara cedri]|uniref:Suppressor of fused-like domain,Suppressor of fused C-terminal,Suppressor of fused, eukaryotic n=1 Tax=Cinara cedri TaxID=506608 RepID=A0A5E4NII8_9HEMI|nr:Suppressor of fused-like domain,Suppressor of fused C-terminal,Suppressor of fused, eukaryotic [Cinara cedri]